MSKHYVTVLVSALALTGYLSGYLITVNTQFWEFGGALYISGLLWFYVAWLVGLAQLAIGALQYSKKSLWRPAVASGCIVLLAQASMFGFGAAGWYLSA